MSRPIVVGVFSFAYHKTHNREAGDCPINFSRLFFKKYGRPDSS